MDFQMAQKMGLQMVLERAIQKAQLKAHSKVFSKALKMVDQKACLKGRWTVRQLDVQKGYQLAFVMVSQKE